MEVLPEKQERSRQEQPRTLPDSLRTPFPSPGWFFLEARHLPRVGEEVMSPLSALS